MTEPIPEFSRLISVARIPPHGLEESLEAKPEEREALAKRFDLISVKSLIARVEVHPDAKQAVAVTGRMQADVVQNCVVTLEPITAHLDLEIATHFIPAESHQEGAGSPYSDDGDEEFEIFTGGKIDLGEMIAQYLGINLDLYPRKDGVALPPLEFGPEIVKPQPFAQLKTLKKSQKKDDITKK